MDNFYFIGVDVSKKKLDFCVLFEGKVLREEQVSNHQQAVARLIGELKNDLEMDNEQFLICAEHTGQYTFPLVCACKSVECKLWLENPSQIKYSSGMQRGKNDKVDAKRIAIYASRFGDKVKYYDRPSEEIERLNSWRGSVRFTLPTWLNTKARCTIRKILCRRRFIARKQSG